jgi:hypothetical protein
MLIARAGIDWDNDGFINWGAKAPLNLVDNPAYTSVIGSHLVGSTGVEGFPSSAPSVPSVNEYGVIGRKIMLNSGAGLNGSPASQWYVGMKNWDYNRYFGGGADNAAYHNGDMDINYASDYTPFRTPLKTNDGTHAISHGATSTSQYLFLGTTSTTYAVNNPLVSGFTVLPMWEYSVAFTHVIPRNDYVSQTMSFSAIDTIAAGNHTTGGTIPLVLENTTTTCTDRHTLVRYQYTFSTPIDCTSVIFLVGGIFSAAIPAAKPYLTGFNLFTDVVISAPIAGRFLDTEVVNSASDFQFSGTGVYTASFYAKATDEFSSYTIGVGKYRYAINSSTKTYEGSQTVTVSNQWKRISHTFTLTDEAPVFVVSQVAQTFGGEVEIRGFSVVAGSQVGDFNTGELSVYDTLDPITIDCDAAVRSGMPNEGVCTIVMGNSSRMYSPNNEDSPLYGYMHKNIVGEVQVYTEGSWRTLWRGWVDEYTAEAGLYRTLQSTIKLSQGVFRLREAEPLKNTYIGKTSDYVVKDLINNSGWWSASASTMTPIGSSALVGVNTFVLDTAETFSTIERGVLEYEFAGLGWGETSTVEGILKDIVDGEKSLLWIDREGRIQYGNREHWLSKIASAVTLSLDTEVQNAGYTYGADVKNRIKGFVNPKSEGAEQDIWTTVRPISVTKYRHVYIPINVQYEDGTPATVLNYTPDVTFTVFRKQRTYANLTTGLEEVTGTDKDRIKVSLVPDGRGGKLLDIQNSWWVSIYVEATVKGTLMERTANETWVFSDDEAISSEHSVYVDSLKSKLIATEEHARGAAQVVLAKSAVADGEFTDMTIKIGDDTEKYIRLLKIGEVVSLTESQTDEGGKLHGIVGEKYNIANGTIQADYQLERIPDTRYAVADVAVARPYTKNLLEQTYENVGDALYTNTGEYLNIKTVYGGMLLSGYEGQSLYNDEFPYKNPQNMVDTWGWSDSGLRDSRYSPSSMMIPYVSLTPELGLITPPSVFLMFAPNTASAYNRVNFSSGAWSSVLTNPTSILSGNGITAGASGTLGIAVYNSPAITISNMIYAKAPIRAWLPAGTYRMSIWYKAKASNFSLALTDIASSTIADAQLGVLALGSTGTFSKATMTITTTTATAPYMLLLSTAGAGNYAEIDVIGWGLTEGTVDYDNFDDIMVKADNSYVAYA